MSYLRKVWRGEERLAFIFWGWLVGLQVALSILSHFLHGGAPAEQLSAGQWVIAVIKILTAAWALVGCWRASERAVPLWRNATRIAVVLWFAGLAFIILGLLTIGALGPNAVEKLKAMESSMQQRQAVGANP